MESLPQGTGAKFTAERMYLPLQNAFSKYIDTELNYTVRSPVYIKDASPFPSDDVSPEIRR